MILWWCCDLPVLRDMHRSVAEAVALFRMKPLLNLKWFHVWFLNALPARRFLFCWKSGWAGNI